VWNAESVRWTYAYVLTVWRCVPVNSPSTLVGQSPRALAGERCVLGHGNTRVSSSVPSGSVLRFDRESIVCLADLPAQVVCRLLRVKSCVSPVTILNKKVNFSSE
jgi:hypothetical protein